MKKQIELSWIFYDNMILFQTLRLTQKCLRWIVSQVQEQTHILHRSIFLKVLLEESSGLHVGLQEQKFGFKTNSNAHKS